MRGWSLGRVFGIEVRVHPSWLVIALLVVWSLARAALPADFPAIAPATRLVMAAAITLLFFGSLLAHELAHSLVAVARGIPVQGITFFLFGGMAQTTMDSRSPGEEFLIAIVGPLCSLLIAALCFALWIAGAGQGWPGAAMGVIAYTGALNLILAVFNLLPGYPMDGGRVLRAAIWKASGNVDRATRWASRVGEWLALGLVAYGAWSAIRGDVLGGLWLVLIGMFIRKAARIAYQQHVLARLHVAARQWAAGAEAGSGDPRGAGTGPGGVVRPHSPQAGPEAPPELTGRDVTHLGPPRP